MVELADAGLLEQFANREPFPADPPDAAQILVGFKGAVLGHAMVDNGILHSRFPRVGWRFRVGK